MFNKEEFSKILLNIQANYNNQEDFARYSGIGRTSISQYINCKIEIPPKPHLLEKIAQSSKGLTNYNELLWICGYKQMIDEYNLLVNGDLRYLDKLFEGKELNNDEKIQELNKLKDGLANYLNSCNNQIEELKTRDKFLVQDSIATLNVEIKMTNEKINGLQKMIDQLGEKSKN